MAELTGFCGHDEQALRNIATHGAPVAVVDQDGDEVLYGHVQLLRGQRDRDLGDSYEITIVFDLSHKLRRADR